MHKWKLKSSSSKEKYLILIDKKIGHVKFSNENKDLIDSELSDGKIPTSAELLPFTYINRILSKVSSTKVDIFYKKESELTYEFEELSAKQNFFRRLIDENAGLKISRVEISLFQSIKKQLVAGIILFLYLGWCYVSASAIEDGTHIGRDLVVVLLVAGLGTQKIALLLFITGLILGIKMYLNVKNREPIDKLLFK